MLTEIEAIRLTDLLLDVLAAMDSGSLSDTADLADPLTAMLAAWALSVRNDLDQSEGTTP